MRRRIAPLLFSLALLACSGNVNNGSPSLWLTNLQSADVNGIQGDAGSWFPSISADGKYVTFSSISTNLLPEKFQPNQNIQLYRRNTETGKVDLVSVSIDGITLGNDDCFFSSISGDGRYVVFDSSATNLVPNFENSNGGLMDVYVRDMDLGVTTLLSAKFGSTSIGGGDPDEGSNNPKISRDGNWIVFESNAEDLHSGGPSFNDNNTHLFLYQWKEPRSANTNPIVVDFNQENAVVGNKSSSTPAISSNGRYVVFESHSTNLTTDLSMLTAAHKDIVLWDQDPDGDGIFLEDELINASGYPWVAGTDGKFDVYLRYTSPATLNSPAVEPTDKDCNSPSVTDDGWVSFNSDSLEIVSLPQDVSGQVVYLFKPAAITEIPSGSPLQGSLEILSKNSQGKVGVHGSSSYAYISVNGKFVVFISSAKNYIGFAYPTEVPQVYFRDLQSGKTEIVSTPSGGGVLADGPSLPAFISEDGKSIVFTSMATNLVETKDVNGTEDIFLRQFGR